MQFLVNAVKAVALVSSICVALLALPLTATSQCIEITPESWDYGDVEIGASASQIFDVYSCATSDVSIYFIGIVYGDTVAFSVTSVPEVPFALPGGEILAVEIIFAPPDLGAYESSLYVLHDAPGGESFIGLYGVGVQQAPVEEETWTLIKALYR